MSSLVAARRRKLQQNGTTAGKLNLVSLMDIFTILVFFLMINSSDVEILQTSSDVELPDSTSEQRPDEQTVVTVSDESIVVMGRQVAQVADLVGTGDIAIEGLAQELRYQAERKGEAPEDGYEITIMGDRQIPYWLLKKIMLTCTTEDYARISLAVNRLQGASDVESPAADSQAAVGASS